MMISGDVIIKKKQIKADIGRLWRQWTTRDGLLTFFGTDNRIELSIGGAFEIYFLMEKPYGERGSEGCRILSYLPERMLSFSWNAPPQFPEIRNSGQKTWVVVELHQASETETDVCLTHLGWPDDGSWSEVFDYFNSAWDRVLRRLEESVE